MSFGEAIKSGFKNYAVFEGRAGRAEYWWWWLFQFIVLTVLGIIAAATSTAVIVRALSGEIDPIVFVVNGFGFTLFYLATFGLFIPHLSITVRRLRDTGRKAWYLLLALVPVAGSLTILIMLMQRSKEAPGISAASE